MEPYFLALCCSTTAALALTVFLLLLPRLHGGPPQRWADPSPLAVLSRAPARSALRAGERRALPPALAAQAARASDEVCAALDEGLSTGRHRGCAVAAFLHGQLVVHVVGGVARGAAKGSPGDTWQRGSRSGSPGGNASGQLGPSHPGQSGSRSGKKGGTQAGAFKEAGTRNHAEPFTQYRSEPHRNPQPPSPPQPPSLAGWTPVRPDSLFMAYSVSKGVAATTLATLVDQGHLRWEDPVRDVWGGRGEFAAAPAATMGHDHSNGPKRRSAANDDDHSDINASSSANSSVSNSVNNSVNTSVNNNVNDDVNTTDDDVAALDKAGITVEEALSHRAGLGPQSFPPLGQSVWAFWRRGWRGAWDVGTDWLESVRPKWGGAARAAGRAEYHLVSFSWIAGGIAQGAAPGGAMISDTMRRNVAEPLRQGTSNAQLTYMFLEYVIVGIGTTVIGPNWYSNLQLHVVQVGDTVINLKLVYPLHSGASMFLGRLPAARRDRVVKLEGWVRCCRSRNRKRRRRDDGNREGGVVCERVCERVVAGDERAAGRATGRATGRAAGREREGDDAGREPEGDDAGREPEGVHPFWWTSPAALAAALRQLLLRPVLWTIAWLECCILVTVGNSVAWSQLCLPSSNGYFTAVGVARMYGALANDGTVDVWRPARHEGDAHGDDDGREEVYAYDGDGGKGHKRVNGGGDGGSDGGRDEGGDEGGDGQERSDEGRAESQDRGNGGKHGTTTTVRLLSKDTLRGLLGKLGPDVTTVGSPTVSSPPPSRLSCGFSPWYDTQLHGPDAAGTLGHSGIGGCTAFCDPKSGLSVCFMTSMFRPMCLGLENDKSPELFAVCDAIRRHLT